MKAKQINASEAARNFSEILNQVRYQGAQFDIKRGREVIARLCPAQPVAGLKVADLEAFYAAMPALGEDAAAFKHDLAEIRRDAVMPPSLWD